MMHRRLNFITQFAIPFFTLGGVLLVALKFPGWGLLFNLCAQPFWLYSTYRSWKEANQFGVFVNTVIMTLIIIFGVLNYFIF